MNLNVKIIHFLKKAVDSLQSQDYQWGHSGACNCGHLAQAITGYSKGDILRFSQEREGDWKRQAELYCETSGEKIDNVIKLMLEQGLKLEDIEHIENLSHRKILEMLPGGFRHLEKNQKQNVILYFAAWISLLENQVEAGIKWNSNESTPNDEVVIYDSIPEEVY
ncbi:MAG: hypothetical protein HRT44_07955 [Bdellovibrionales bacterium]|nr:hypothetical protein [Bdellovibrionales bacterium]